jgi:hypothetical protein
VQVAVYQACAEPRTSGGGLETQPIRDHNNALSVISASWRSGIMRFEQVQSRSNGCDGAVYHRESPLSPQAIGCTSTMTACPLLPFYAQTIAPTTSFVALMLLEGCSTIVFRRLLCDSAAFELDAAVFTVCTCVLGPRAVHHDEKRLLCRARSEASRQTRGPRIGRFGSIGDKVVDVCTSLLVLSWLLYGCKTNTANFENNYYT